MLDVYEEIPRRSEEQSTPISKGTEMGSEHRGTREHRGSHVFFLCDTQAEDFCFYMFAMCNALKLQTQLTFLESMSCARSRMKCLP